MKKWLYCLLAVLSLFSSAVAEATGREYIDSCKVYTAAGACMAAYSDRYGRMADLYLSQDGWRIEHFEKTGDSADARFLIARKMLGTDAGTMVLAIVGTENERDMRTNLKFDKVWFAGSDSAGFESAAATKNVLQAEPKVHRGYHQLVQRIFEAKAVAGTDGEMTVAEYLLADKARRIYLTGHSLGGASATLLGARLIQAGVLPGQIEVVTFGAPAVGNQAFAEWCGSRLDLTRVVISGDPVTGVFQSLVGGYKQFGREVRWELPEFLDQPHRVANYCDLAIKQYYDARRSIQDRLPPIPAAPSAAGSVYMAPLQLRLPPSLSGEERYMRAGYTDAYMKQIPGAVYGTEQDGKLWMKQARLAQCRWLIVSEVDGIRMKESQNGYFITVQQTVYDVATGNPVNSGSFTTGTHYLSPLEAFLSAAENALDDGMSCITGRKQRPVE